MKLLSTKTVKNITCETAMVGSDKVSHCQAPTKVHHCQAPAKVRHCQ